MDQLEDFIGKNRGAFDDKEPSEKVWRNIHASIGVGSSKTSWWNSVVVWRAAAMLFMALSFYLLIPKSDLKGEKQLALKEFNDVEAFYAAQISLKEELIDGFGQDEALENFTHDFQQLEAMYTVLKDEMKTQPSKKVKDALVLNLLVRINMLNQQLEKLERDEKKDKEERASNS
jgi:hypothetical protein